MNVYVILRDGVAEHVTDQLSKATDWIKDIAALCEEEYNFYVSEFTIGDDGHSVDCWNARVYTYNSKGE